MLEGTKDCPIVIADDEPGEVVESLQPQTSGSFTRLKGRKELPRTVAVPYTPSKLQRRQQVLPPVSHTVDIQLISDSEEGEIIEEHIMPEDPGYRLLQRLGGDIDSASMLKPAFATSNPASRDTKALAKRKRTPGYNQAQSQSNALRLPSKPPPPNAPTLAPSSSDMSMSEPSPSAKRIRLTTEYNADLPTKPLPSNRGPKSQRRYERTADVSSITDDSSIILDYGGPDEPTGMSTYSELPLQDIIPLTNMPFLIPGAGPTSSQFLPFPPPYRLPGMLPFGSNNITSNHSAFTNLSAIPNENNGHFLHSLHHPADVNLPIASQQVLPAETSHNEASGKIAASKKVKRLGTTRDSNSQGFCPSIGQDIRFVDVNRSLVFEHVPKRYREVSFWLDWAKTIHLGGAPSLVAYCGRSFKILIEFSSAADAKKVYNLPRFKEPTMTGIRAFWCRKSSSSKAFDESQKLDSSHMPAIDHRPRISVVVEVNNFLGTAEEQQEMADDRRDLEESTTDTLSYDAVQSSAPPLAVAGDPPSQMSSGETSTRDKPQTNDTVPTTPSGQSFTSVSDRLSDLRRRVLASKKGIVLGNSNDLHNTTVTSSASEPLIVNTTFTSRVAESQSEDSNSRSDMSFASSSSTATLSTPGLSTGDSPSSAGSSPSISSLNLQHPVGPKSLNDLANAFLSDVIQSMDPSNTNFWKKKFRFDPQIQLERKQKRLERHIADSKELMASYANAKSKEEKNKIMTILREKNKNFDEQNKASELLFNQYQRNKLMHFNWPETNIDDTIIVISDSEDDESDCD